MRIWSLLVHCPGSIPIACSRALLEQEPSLDQRIPGVGMVARILFGFGGLDVNVPLEAQERHARALEEPGAECDAAAGDRRSEERRVGKEGVSTLRSRGSPDHYKKN